MENKIEAIVMYTLIVLLSIGFLVLLGGLLAVLWNYTMPYIFGLPSIDLFQGLALMFIVNMLVLTPLLNVNYFMVGRKG